MTLLCDRCDAPASVFKPGCIYVSETVMSGAGDIVTRPVEDQRWCWAHSPWPRQRGLFDVMGEGVGD